MSYFMDHKQQTPISPTIEEIILTKTTSSKKNYLVSSDYKNEENVLFDSRF